MAKPRDLRRPPIVEALVDLRAAATPSKDVFEKFAEHVKEHYPKRDTLNEVAVQLQINQGVLVSGGRAASSSGIRVRNADETLQVQARSNGFTVNNLRTYVGGDVLLSEAMEVWDEFVRHFRPTSVTRIALRYINNFPLPADQSPSRYLANPPQMTTAGPQELVEGLSRVVSYDRESGTKAIVAQRLSPAEGGNRDFIIDVDVFREGDFGLDRATLLPVLQDLRRVKNDVFFSSLRDETLLFFGENHAGNR